MSGAAKGLAAAAAGLATGFAYLRATWPWLDVPNHHGLTRNNESARVAEVGACRVRFPGSVAAQGYYPTTRTTKAECQSYNYFRPNVVDAQQRAVRQSRVALDVLGVSTAASACKTAVRGVRGNPPPEVVGGAETKLPVLLFSHGLYGHCDIHCVIGCQLALRGYIVVVMEHEGGAASYCVTEGGEQIAYNRPPDLTAGEKAGGYPTLHRLIRGFRGPILRHRERKIARVVTCLREGRAYPLRGDTGLPFDEVGGGDDDDNNNDDAGADEKNAAAAHCQRLLSSIDLDRMHMVGHSFGGATAILAAQSNLPALRDDPPFKSCLLFDPWCECLPESALAQGMGDLPTFAICSGAWGCGQKVKFFDQIERLLSDMSTSPRATLAVMPGTLHNWVADIPFWGPWALLKRIKLAADVDPDIAVSNTIEASCVFIDGVERGTPSWVSESKDAEAKAHGLVWLREIEQKRKLK